MLFQNKDFYQLVHFEMVNQKRACDFSAFSEINKKNLKLLQNIIEEGQKDGEFKSNCNSLLIPALVIGTFSQIYNNKKFYIEMLNLNDDKAFENYMLNTFKEDITNVVLGMLIK
jgi:spermidine/putrescine-binding protein